jgi:hypothetical protein
MSPAVIIQLRYGIAITGRTLVSMTYDKSDASAHDPDDLA